LTPALGARIFLRMSGAHKHGSHHHGHSHGHAHGHGRHADFGPAFAIGIALNTGFIVFEVIFGLISHSVALLADAGHNLGDVLGLIAAWVAYALSKRPATDRFTYGLGSATILAALANAAALLFVTGGVAWEAIRRFADPPEVAGFMVMAVAALGVAVNGVSAWLFARGRKSDLNIRGAFLHLMSDAVVSGAVVVCGLVIVVTGWFWLDPAASLVLCAVILIMTWRLLIDSLRMSMHGVPEGIDARAVRKALESLDGVSRIHDLHIWAMSTADTALTCHLVMPRGHPGDSFMAEAATLMHEKFGVAHATFQIEVSEDAACPLEARH
jgi:cobalt-zinc-cadmium efflux system protein